MSTSTEITRLIQARNTIRNKIVEIFGNNYSAAKIDTLAEVIDGITNQGAVTAEVQEGATYTIPSGYHNGSGVVSGVGGGGSYILQTKTVTPTKASQNVTPDAGKYGLSAVVVEAIPSAYQDVSAVTAEASQVLATKIFVDTTGSNIAGTMVNNGAVNQVISVATPSYTVPTGYHSGAGVVQIVTEAKEVIPSSASQEVVPTSGKVLSKVTVGAIPAPYYDVSGVTAAASQVLADTYYVTSTGVLTEGTMSNNGTISGSFDGLTVLSYTIPSGYTAGGSVTLTSDIENALASI